MTEKLKFVLGMAENSAGKGVNAGYQYFLLFPDFKRFLTQGHYKSGLCVKELTFYSTDTHFDASIIAIF